MNILSWIKAHPVETGGIAFVVIVIVLYFLGFFSSNSSATTTQGDPNASAFFAAESAEAQSGNALQAVQIQAQASTAQDLINANADVTNNNTWASTDLQTAQINANAATAVAPYTTENNLISTLGQVASIAPTTVTSTNVSNDSGFFGIGASSSSSTSTNVIPNPSALNADGLLNSLITDGFNPAH